MTVTVTVFDCMITSTGGIFEKFPTNTFHLEGILIDLIFHQHLIEIIKTDFEYINFYMYVFGCILITLELSHTWGDGE